VNGFGVVLCDVDLPNVSRVECFAYDGERLFSRNILASPGDGSLSFLGVAFENPCVHSVRIFGGDTPLGPNDVTDGGAGDVVALDDFVYGEPQPLPRSLAHTRYSATGLVDAFYNINTELAVGPDGGALFNMRLLGSGASRGRNQALFEADQTLVNPILQNRVPNPDLGYGPDAYATNTNSPISNQSGIAAVETSMGGPGITRFNNRCVMGINPNGVSPLLCTGDPLVELGNGECLKISSTAQCRVFDAYGSLCNLRRSSLPTPAVGPGNDSALVMFDSHGNILSANAREGEPTFGLGGGDTFGQCGSQFGMGQGDQFCFINPVRPGAGGRAVPGVFFSQCTGGGDGLAALSGQIAPGVGFADYRQFIGTTCQANDICLFRSTLSGPDANRGNNEGLFWQNFTKLIQKGEEISPGGPMLNRIQTFCPIGNEQVIIQGLLRGPGVNRGNNQAVFLRQADGDFQILLRSGDPAPGADPGAMVRNIQRVDVDPLNGNYTILGGLKGVPPGENQMLWRGQTTLGDDNANEGERLPNAVLQKGDFYSSTDTSEAIIRGLSINPQTDRSGACGRGAGQIINQRGDIGCNVRTDGREQELVILYGDG
ncbi:MAG: hypothetical protein KDN19_22240, partial [Verrucomicrobiae bacterium]|nr:hypothetical protein [Verrucomicrobiae bacterium]